MRIGILTHHYVSNFGAYLQAYCLREAIAELLPDANVEIIDFVLPKHRLINTLGMCRFFPRNETLTSWVEKLRVIGTFNEAQRRLKRTKRVNSAEQITRLGLDLIVVGSDEVWNYKDVRSFSPIKFGVGLDKTPLVAYSPSAGGVNDFSDMPKELIEGLAGFRRLSARDDNTQRLIEQKLGLPFTRTLDPVFIHKLPSGRTKRVLELTDKPYALMYHFGLDYESRNTLLYPALKKRGLRIIGAGEFNKGYDKLSVNLTPFEMAELFNGAKYVFTGTFHGVVLSVINKTPFVVCPNNPTREEKLASLLTELELNDRLVRPKDFNIDEAIGSNVDYDKTYRILDGKRRVSLKYLSEAVAIKE